jgi:hypothetical protein
MREHENITQMTCYGGCTEKLGKSRNGSVTTQNPISKWLMSHEEKQAYNLLGEVWRFSPEKYNQ